MSQTTNSIPSFEVAGKRFAFQNQEQLDKLNAALEGLSVVEQKYNRDTDCYEDRLIEGAAPKLKAVLTVNWVK